MPTLTIQLPGLPPVEHILREEAVTLGRMKGNSIALDDSSVSLSHAKITRLGNDYFLKDLNSTNGTMLNGQSINEARLRDADRLKFGEVVAVFQLEPSFAPVAPPAGSPPAADPAPQPAAQTVPAPLVAAASAPSPAPAPKFAGLPAPRPAALAPAPIPPAARGARRNLVRLLAPALGGISAAGVIGFVIWRLVGGGAPQPQSAPPPGPLAKQTAASMPAPKSVPVENRTKPIDSRPPTTPTAELLPEAVAPQPQNASLAALIADLKSSDVVTRRTAAQAISSIESGAKAAVPALRVSLNDADADVRMWSALALVNNQTYDKAAIPILVQVLKHESPTLRQVACISLALIPFDAADKAAVVPALKRLAAEDSSPEVRTDALTALKVIAPESVHDK